MLKNFERLQDREIIDKYGETYSGFSTKTRKMLVYWLLDFLRKAVLCIALVTVSKHLWFQILVAFMTSVTLIIAVNYSEARAKTFDRRMDIFNEVKLIFLMYHMILFTAFVPDAETKYYIGYSCAINLLIGLAVNMLMLVVQPVKLLCYKQRIQYHFRRKKKQLLERKEKYRFSAKTFNKRRKKYLKTLIDQAK